MNGELSWVLFVRYMMKSQRDCGIIDPKSEEQGCKTWLHVYLLFVLFVIFNSFWITLKNIYIYFTSQKGFHARRNITAQTNLTKVRRPKKKQPKKTTKAQIEKDSNIPQTLVTHILNLTRSPPGRRKDPSPPLLASRYGGHRY